MLCLINLFRFCSAAITSPLVFTLRKRFKRDLLILPIYLGVTACWESAIVQFFLNLI